MENYDILILILYHMCFIDTLLTHDSKRTTIEMVLQKGNQATDLLAAEVLYNMMLLLFPLKYLGI